MQYPPLHADRLLFVGLNPSYSEQAQAAGDDVNLKDPAELQDANLVRERIEWEMRWRQGKPPYPYFRPFDEFGLPWEHVDLFAIREADQAIVRTALALPDHSPWTDFAEVQFESLTTALRPNAIVVVSALGAWLLLSRWSTALTSGDCDANHIWRCAGRGVPVFCAGMLSGAHAMDRFSKARLLRDVQRVLNIGPSVE